MEDKTIHTSEKDNKTNNFQERALDGVTVLEYCSMVSGPYCAKTMADLGAEVIKIEQPIDGDPGRQMPPFPGDKPHPEKSGLFLYLNTNKQGITLDPETPEGKQIFLELAKRADILVEDHPPGEMERMGLGYDDLRAINKGLIVTSITPFGLTGPYRDYKGRALNMSHASAQAYLLPLLSPHADRPPVKVGANTSDYDPGLVAAVAVLAALYWKGISGRGQHIDMSKQEALISMQRVESVTYANDEVVMTRTGNKGYRIAPHSCYRCSGEDKWISIAVATDKEWEGLCRTMDRPDLIMDKRFAAPEDRYKNQDDLDRIIVEWTKDKESYELMAHLQAAGVAATPTLSSEGLFKDPHVRDRGVFQQVEHPVIGNDWVIAPPWRLSETPAQINRHAPLLGEHNEYVFGELLGMSSVEIKRLEQEKVIY